MKRQLNVEKKQKQEHKNELSLKSQEAEISRWAVRRKKRKYVTNDMLILLLDTQSTIRCKDAKKLNKVVLIRNHQI